MKYSPETLQKLELKMEDTKIILQKFLTTLEDTSKPADVRILYASINHLELSQNMQTLLNILDPSKQKGLEGL